jgi:hypothetical protein
MNLAKAFVTNFKVTFPMLWEDGYESWTGFGITRQPASVLVSKHGKELKRYLGALDESDRAEVLKVLSAS